MDKVWVVYFMFMRNVDIFDYGYFLNSVIGIFLFVF